MARLGEVPFRFYYGTVDATPLFLMLAGMYFERTGDRETLAEIWPNIEAALRWIDEYGDRDGDGFVEYYRETEQGLANQGWKDSHDSIFHADGSDAEGPIALCEVQGYVYAAKHSIARVAAALGHDELALESRGTDRAICAGISRRRSGARTSAPMRWRSTGRSGPAACAPPMPGTPCSRASPPPTGRAGSRAC